MNKQMITNQRIKEQYIKVEHPTGLTILLYPMKGYSSAYALFGTKYGSTDRSFKTNLDDDFVTVPDGIAHYLEHKLFESEDGVDAFSLYAKTGANANAYTSFDKTAYLFSCTDNFKESLEILLNFVQSPYFTKETVEKEQGIIGQEIRMYDDDAGWRVLFNALGCMYQNHPVKVDIAGTVESISHIDKDLLYRCYNTFYNLNNMVLAISGNFDPDEALQIINANLKENEKITIERGSYQEPAEIVQNRKEISLEIALPLFCIGYKMQPASGKEQLKAEVASDLINELLVGEGSELYRQFYDTGLISGGAIGSEVMDGNGYFCNLFEGESRDPDQVYAFIQQKVSQLQKDGIPKEEFELAKKMLYGRCMRQFNNVEAVASNLLDSYFSGVDVYDRIETVANIQYQDVVDFLKQYDNEKSVISIVFPVGKES
ncbi:EF-P 5-aminopentanol modification-associated protein YfmH [Massilioclostridium coli]|uniref:EF-P 5-aminopentanol modification-associated protein YfmH n=1 Tax=Massilioclostridium coli TaxID=1870991 RepID=UPI00085BB762|nr:pitrilysin family protein [Massilioclostridium coli]